MVILDGQRSYHHSSSDELHSEKTHDAFSIFCFFEHSGDVKTAVKAAAEELGLRPAPKAAPQPIPPVPEAFEILNTDAGNARRLVGLFGQDIRYCPEWKTWLVWTGQRASRRDRHL